MSAAADVLTGTSSARVLAAYEALAASGRPEVWITVRDRAGALAEAARVDERVAAGEDLPLAGTVFAVKDNVDVAGMPTTAACPGYERTVLRSATAVQRLVDAGAVVVGKTNLDQFATGLVGTRSPYGAVRDAERPDRISGGSSSGSAVAVALGVVDFALGTDTAGSGRVPAALQGVVGLKPTVGLVPVTGVVPACRSFDCVTAFTPDVALARRVLAVMAGPDPADPTSRPRPASAPLAAPAAVRVGVVAATALPQLSPAARAAYAAAVTRALAAGAVAVPVDPEPFLAAGRLLYGGAFVAERYAAVGEALESQVAGLDPVVAGIVGAARDVTAARYVRDRERLDALRAETAAVFAGIDVLLLPTTTGHPLVADVAADPVGVNAALGTFTTFTNLLDLAAVAVPAGRADGGHVGVTVMAPAFGDHVAADVAERIALGGVAALRPADPAAPQAATGDGLPLFVVGAHLRGQPLEHELAGAGARWLGPVATAARYELHALETVPPKPGLRRVRSGGAQVPGELWEVPAARLGAFLAALPPPMALGPVLLADGRRVTGFLAEPLAFEDAVDITAAGGWRAHLRGDGPPVIPRG
ncbi:allophanate hydrolase [Kineococcus xinjiangensis]|uniref:Allophanate hydrolase n=1 Tax=Kineococcus xinjiangensis TaxID=512762 RepID=A0A2S6ISR0_9ACTN|nr:allophanate hydrolase [Kineococcus xinjiangensis]PPK97268.1 allophanate hydrolase [Kineococcus xinjiangensis]